MAINIITSLKQKVKKSKLTKQLLSLPLIVIFLWLIVFFLEPRFFSSENFSNLGRQMTIISIVAIGQTVVIITKGIDLSVGSVVGLASVLSALMFASNMNPIIVIALTVFTGILIGLFNGMLV